MEAAPECGFAPLRDKRARKVGKNLALICSDAILAFASFRAAAQQKTPAAQRALSFGPVRFLGDVSYSFYLVHLAVLVFVTSWLLPATGSGPICILAALAAMLLVAAAFRHTIELPVRY